MSLAFLTIAAVAADAVMGEPQRWHPLVGFARYATIVERLLYREMQRWRGSVGVVLAIVPFVALAAWLEQIEMIGAVFSILALYFALGLRSLHEHARTVGDALRAGDVPLARRQVARIVSRDTQAMTPRDVATATTESVLENGNDAVFGALFWFAVGGAPAVVLYRLANTLDAMWGYHNARYEHFGWAAARLDDVLNFIPARLTALTYALLGNTRRAFECWHCQAPTWDSPNAGPVMAAGAGALDLQLGGGASYDGEWCERPVLGAGDVAQAYDIERALSLVRHGVALWLFVIVSVEWLHA